MVTRLAAHPVVGRSAELAAFLRAPERAPLAGTVDVASRLLDGAVRLPGQLFRDGAAGHVLPQDAVQPAKGGRNLLRMFKELKQSVANDWGGAKPAVMEEDKEFLERKVKIQDIEQQLTVASQQVSAIGVPVLGLGFCREDEEETYASRAPSRDRLGDTLEPPGEDTHQISLCMCCDS